VLAETCFLRDAATMAKSWTNAIRMGSDIKVGVCQNQKYEN